MVVGVLLFVGAGFVAFKMLNIEAYPNPTPVILEITAQAPGLSAEEMERYYTHARWRSGSTPLRASTSSARLRSTGCRLCASTSNMAMDYYFAFRQAAVAMQQNVSLPGEPCSNDPGEQLHR